MKPSEALQIVLKAVCEITDSQGTPDDVPHVEEYLKSTDPFHCPSWSWVVRIPLGNFYANYGGVIDGASLWQQVEIEAGVPVGSIPTPTWIQADTELCQLAHYLGDHV